jgi:PST family polysaccharide transporter
VARLLSPEDYGLLGMATIYLGFVTNLTEFGIGTTVVTLRDLRREQLAQLNTVAMLLGVAGVLVSLGMSGVLARFFDAPQLRWVVIVMSATFIITSLATVPTALLQRDLQFKTLALIEGAKTVLTALSMVVLAWLGFRYWTLVIGALLGVALSTGLTLRCRRSPFARPRLASIREALDFSQHIITGRLAWYWFTNADFLIAGKLLGKAPLGAYSFGWNLSRMIPSKVTDLVGRVTPGFYSAIQDDPAELRRNLLNLTSGIALITFPATFGLALVADDFVRFALGDKWEAAIGPLRLLAIYAGLQSIFPIVTQVLIVTGNQRFNKWTSVAAGIVLPIGFIAGAYWGGGTGIAAAWLLYPLVWTPVLWRVSRTISLPIRSYLASLWPAVSGALLMAVAVLATARSLPPEVPSGPALFLQIAAGAAGYVLVLTTLHRERLRSFQQTLSRLRK